MTAEADGFRDRNHRFSYLIACENARRVLSDPAALAAGIAHLERFTRHDPSQAPSYRLWGPLLAEGPTAVAARLTEVSPRGDYTRETAPSFGGLPGPVRADLLRRARQPLACCGGLETAASD